MKKKVDNTETVQVTSTYEVTAEQIQTLTGISKIDHDFGREDLNMMRDKINELINKQNG